MLEFYDFITYSFFAIQIGHTFFPSQSQFNSLMLSLATFGAGFITRPIGALVIGAYSDRVGRRPAMVLSFALMGSAIVALALIPSYDAIGVAAPVLAILARMAQGFSLGGEVGPTTAYLMEAAAADKRARRRLATREPANCGDRGALMGLALSLSLSSEALRILRLAHRLPVRRAHPALWLMDAQQPAGDAAPTRGELKSAAASGNEDRGPSGAMRGS